MLRARAFSAGGWGRRWRETWGLNGALPPDCEECKREDGGGLLEMANFLWRKHPSLRVAAITRTEDEIIRLFYSVGLNECKDYERVHPVLKTVLGFFDSSQLYGAERYAAALADVRDYLVAQRYPLSTFMIGPPDATRHQLVFRPDFYTRRVQGRTAAQFVSTFLSGDVVQLGPN